jgi:hypothetical protein
MKDLKKLRQARADKARAGKIKLDALNALLGKPSSPRPKPRSSRRSKPKSTRSRPRSRRSTPKSRPRKRSPAAPRCRLGLGRVPARSMMVNDLNPCDHRRIPQPGGIRDRCAICSPAAAWIRGWVQRRPISSKTRARPARAVLVPTEFRDQIWGIAFPEHDLLSLCNPEPTNSNSISIPKDETTPWGAAGVQAAWRSEGTQMLASKIALTGTQLQLHELFAFVHRDLRADRRCAAVECRLTTRPAAPSTGKRPTL